MNIFTRHKTILLSIIGLILIFFGYWYFVLSKKTAATTKQSGANGGLVKNTDSTPSATAGNKGYDKEFVAGLLSLNTINLDVNIFNSVAYKALSFPEKPFVVDYNIQYGRQNPFLPIGVDAVGISTSITTQSSGPTVDVPPASVVETASTTPTPAPATTTPVKPTPKTFPTNTKR